MRSSSPKSKRINFALQGGGARGAFTWGVLDQVLAEPLLEIEAIAGTSAGAMNAAVAAYGLIAGGREKARELLQEFWHKVSLVARMSPLQPTFIDRMMGPSNLAFSPTFLALDYMTRLFSPAQLNLFDINPLRDIVEEIVDFDAVRKNRQLKLFINATHARSGKRKVFRTHEMTLDMIMASACAPFIFKTVYIDGEPYWDGSYCGNPAIAPLIEHTGCRDIVIVQINPLTLEEVPTRASDIMDRINEISFNGSLMREMHEIDFVNRLVREGKLQDKSYQPIHVHMIEAQEIMAGLAATSKLNADWEFLCYLRDTGIQSALEWIEGNYEAIGKHSSVDVEKTFV
jgi:NTE family protein